MCMVCGVNAGVSQCQRHQTTLELVLPADRSYLTWMLRCEMGSSARTMCASNR